MTEQTSGRRSFTAVPLFATPFAGVNTGADRQFNARVVSLCESRRDAHRLPAEPQRDALLFNSSDDLLDAADATAVELRNLMLACASTVVASLNSVDTAEFARLHIQARGWCSIVQRNGHIPAQHFPNASWLAVYCVQAGEADAGTTGAGVLRLYERRLGAMYRDPSNWELKSPYHYGNHTWAPVSGSMALFPAHLPHEVSVVRSDTPLILVFARIRFMDAGAKDGGKG